MYDITFLFPFELHRENSSLQIFHPIGNTPLGGGRQNNLVFKAYETTQFDFPFTITYRRSMDPGNRILTDLAKRCGFSGGTKSDIEVQYSITVRAAHTQHVKGLTRVHSTAGLEDPFRGYLARYPQRLQV
jgi:hypothetical protein